MNKKLKKIKLIVLDVDGTMTDGKIYINNEGIEMKAFDVKDGFAIANCPSEGIEVAIITGRQSKVVEKRAEELKIKYCYQGIHDKANKLKELTESIGITLEEVCYIGDDINDLPAINIAGFTATPKDGVEDVLSIVDYVAKNKGGKGAIREVIELILREQDKWGNIIRKYNTK